MYDKPDILPQPFHTQELAILNLEGYPNSQGDTSFKKLGI